MKDDLNDFICIIFKISLNSGLICAEECNFSAVGSGADLNYRVVEYGYDHVGHYDSMISQVWTIVISIKKCFENNFLMIIFKLKILL